jgi:predicted nuclease of predicted toxin-antitoxin system
MKFLCDVHISIKISKRIEYLGHDCIHVNHILNKWNSTDSQITEYVDTNDCILISKDQDFRNSYILQSKPKKLIKIHLGNIPNNELILMLEGLMPTLELVNANHSSFMVEVFRDMSKIITND